MSSRRNSSAGRVPSGQLEQGSSPVLRLRGEGKADGAPRSTSLRASLAPARSGGSRSDFGVDLGGEIGFDARQVKSHLKA